MGNPYAPPRPDEPGRTAPERPVDGPDAGRAAPRPPETGPRPTGPRPAGPTEPGGGRTGHRPPARAPEPAADPESARRATRAALHFGLLMLLVVVISAFRFPWRTAALAFAVWAIVVGVRALVVARRARVRGALVPVLAVGVGLAALISVQSLGTLATWQVEAEYQRCLDGAITVSAEERCETERLRTIEGWVSGVTGVPAPAQP
ncbi:cytochrome d ubiquinol oxidase subunit II [Cellulosimicrobium sp. CUA-896]|uniref:cytochrome d ubiquinol oxidase subunit II n=1 Tax=Cellulosimicrobium sp. CUA-896 TaxID=1517881 RepID=UPI001115462C|nr:cytochrome d ubiquinol oxidase subunit II [Cellulosimicrobium sp. CUA-896]